MSVILTEKAAKEVQRVMHEGNYPAETYLRVGVAGGGCSGFQYSLTFVNSTDSTNDLVSEHYGVKVAVDKKSDLFLDGTKLDFYDGLEKRGFTFENPNAVKSCGCGNSFSA